MCASGVDGVLSFSQYNTTAGDTMSTSPVSATKTGGEPVPELANKLTMLGQRQSLHFDMIALIDNTLLPGGSHQL